MEAFKKGSIILIVGVILVFLSFLPWHMVLPPWQCWQRRDWPIDSGVQASFQSEILWGGTIKGQIGCSGGANSIDFVITDSGGKVCLNPGKIRNNQRFKWHVPYNDIYSFKFDNTFDESPKKVEYLICLYYYKDTLLVIGSVLAGAGLFIVMREVINRTIAGPERESPLPSRAVVKEQSKKLEELRMETEELKSAVRDLQTTIAELLERTRQLKSE